MTDFKTEFEKLVADIDLTNADENFQRVFPDDDFIIDDKEVINIDGVIEGLYMQCEQFEPLLKSAEIDDTVLERLNDEAIADILRDVFKEEVKARPVSVLAKELESNILKKEAENRKSFMSTRSSYMTAKSDNSDYESPGEDSDTLSDYGSCDEGLASPSIVRTIMSEPEFLKSFSPEEEVEERFVVDNKVVNDVEFRVKKEGVIDVKEGEDAKHDGDNDTVKEMRNEVITVEDHNVNEIRKEIRVQKKEEVKKEKNMIDAKKEEAGKRDDSREKTVRETQNERVTVEEHIENEIMKEVKVLENGEIEKEKDGQKSAKEKMIVEVDAVIRRKEFKEIIQKTVEDNASEFNGSDDAPDRKRKISQKAVEIAENIVIGKPVRSSTVDSPQKLPLIRVPLVKKERPNRRSLERMSTDEHRSKFLELLKKMELKQDEDSYHSVYNKNH